MLISERGAFIMEKQYVKTERAHVMCPNMHFGMVIEVNANYCLNKAQKYLEHI